MADEIGKVENTESRKTTATQNVSQYNRPETKKKEETPSPKSEPVSEDSSRFSKEASKTETESTMQGSNDIGSQFKSSLWESVQNAQNEKGSSPQSMENERAYSSQDRNLRETSRDYENTRASMSGKLLENDDTLRSNARQSFGSDNPMAMNGGGDNNPMAMNGQGNNNLASPAGNDLSQKPLEGASPKDAVNQQQQMQQQMQQMQMQQMQMMQQMMQMQMQMMSQMMNMMSQMNGRNNGGNNGGNNPLGPVNNNNRVDPANNTNPRRWGDLVGSWRQGAEGNCVSVATIKAAMQKYGNNVFKSTERTPDGGYNLTLQDGKKVSVSAQELETANRMNRFVGNGAERDYANLCYAAMAKRALENGHEGARTFARACHSLNNGEAVEYPMNLLGLKGKYKRISLNDMKNHDSVITWNHNHCLYANNGRVDGYGRATSASRWGLHGAYALI